MHEDILCSTMVLYNAWKMVSVPNTLIYYYRHNKAATSVLSPQGISKRIHDNGTVLLRMKNFLKNKGIYDEYKGFHDQWISYLAGGDRHIIRNAVCHRKDRSILKKEYNKFFKPFGYSI